MTVSLAKSGQEAIEIYRDQSFDLALLDLHMPDMDGFELFNALTALEIDTKRHIPKLAFTADALQETREACLAHGFADFIVKPADPDQLVDIVVDSLPNIK